MKASILLLTSVWIGILGNVAVQAAESDKPTKSLLDAAREGDLEQMRRHVARGSKLDAPDAYGMYTPLKCVVEGRNMEGVQILLDAGANPNVKDRDGMTPLMVACNAGQKEIAEALLAKGAEVNAKDNYDRTALHSAINAARHEMVVLLVNAGADVNATDKQGQMPLAMAKLRSQTDTAQFLTEHGAKEPVLDDRYGAYGDEMVYSEMASQQAAAATYREPAPEIEIDPNAIRQQMQEFEGLADALKAVDDKSAMEVRGWVQRRADNRTSLLRSVEKQFELEMSFLKPLAVEEKAEETVKEIDDLTARRKKRYELIGDELRDQRREMLLESRNSAAGGRGRYSGRGTSSRGRSARSATQGNMDPYGGYSTEPARPTRPTRQREEPNEPPIDADTQSQIQAWANARIESKKDLLDSVHEVDLYELGLVYEVAQEEEAKKTSVAVLALMMVREQRLEAIAQKWVEDDERMQRMQERYGNRGGTGMQDTQTGTGRGRRRY